VTRWLSFTSIEMEDGSLQTERRDHSCWLFAKFHQVMMRDIIWPEGAYVVHCEILRVYP
jgi:hypothetical protein